MSDDQEPRNRRERRAAAKKDSKPMPTATKQPKVKLAQPDRSAPKNKTLMDLYEEKKSLLDQGQPFSPAHTDGQVRDESGNILEAGLSSSDPDDEDDEPIGPLGQAVFWSVCLAMCHFTLDVLVYNQYRQEIEWGPIWRRTFTMLPVLWFVVFMLRTETARRWPVLRQVFFLVVGVVAGCYTIYAGNEFGYYAMMKRAPPLGTLWLWSVVEMDLSFALVSVACNAVYFWYEGYGTF